MATISSGFADYCCELLSSLGPCKAKRMFGGWGISVDGLNVAILANLGSGDTLWLKANEDSRARFEAAGCQRFTYTAKGQERSANYYSAPADAMESPPLMQDWARLAMEAALAARKPPAKKKPPPGCITPAKPPRGR